MKENDFTRDLKNTFQKQFPNDWIYRIPDMPRFGSASKFVPTKPADLIGTLNTKAFLIECKQIKKWQPFGLKELRESQIKSLEHFETVAGNTSLVILNVRVKANKAKNIKHENRLLIFQWKWLKYFKRLSTDEIKKWSFVAGSSINDEMFYELNHLPNYLNW